MEAGEEPGEGQGCLCEGKAAVRPCVGLQLRKGADPFLEAEIDGADHQFRFFAQACEDLDRGLAVDVHRHVQDLSAMLDAVWGGVGPAPGEIQPHRASGPDDLIPQHTRAGGCGGELGFEGDCLAELGKGQTLLLRPGRIPAVAHHGGSEHPVVHHLQRVIVGGELQLRNTAFGRGEDFGCGFQIKAEEDAASEVFEHRWGAGLAKRGALPVKAAEVHLIHDLPGAQFASTQPPARRSGIFGRLRLDQPLHKVPRELLFGEDGEDGCRLDIGERIEIAGG